MDAEILEEGEITVDLSSDFSLTRPDVLSSNKLTVPVLSVIARILDMPFSGSKEETLEEKLQEEA